MLKTFGEKRINNTNNNKKIKDNEKITNYRQRPIKGIQQNC